MIVMPSNNKKMEVGYMAGKYPGRVGHLYAPGGYPATPYGDWLPYALDNGMFGAFLKTQEFGKTQREWWPEHDFDRMVAQMCSFSQKPRWIVVPDCVCDPGETLRMWAEFAPKLRKYGVPLAIAVQDGMTVADVPGDADVVFVGGSTEWKWCYFDVWPRAGFRTHVGRVNSYRYLVDCHKAGIESVDGTGWFRGDQKQVRGLRAYLEQAANDNFGPEQMTLFQATEFSNV
jgi:hypothetical protein